MKIKDIQYFMDMCETARKEQRKQFIIRILIDGSCLSFIFGCPVYMILGLFMGSCNPLHWQLAAIILLSLTIFICWLIVIRGNICLLGKLKRYKND